MLKETHELRIDDIYVPAKARRRLNTRWAEELAESILEDGQRIPIQVRRGDGRYVLVSGLHRLEACRALGEETIQAVLVQPRKH